MKRVAIIGSHGIYASYGGWDQLVINLAELKSQNFSYLIFNSSDTKIEKIIPTNVKVVRSMFKADGIQGFFYDFVTILRAYFTCDTLLLLGAQGIPIISLLKFFKKTKIVTNVGGIEWERPKFN